MTAFVEKADLEHDRVALVSYKNPQENVKKMVTSLQILYRKIIYQVHLKYLISSIS